MKQSQIDAIKDYVKAVVELGMVEVTRSDDSLIASIRVGELSAALDKALGDAFIDPYAENKSAKRP